MIFLENSGYATCVLAFSVLLIGVASVGPSTIKTLGAKWGAGGGHIGFDRYQPTEEEKKLVNKISQDELPSGAIEAMKIYLAGAENRPPEIRSAEDYLALATDKWRAKNYGAALEDVYAGLALKPKDIRIEATLINIKGLIFIDLGLDQHAKECFLAATKIDSSYSMPFNNIGNFYLRQGNQREAEKFLQKAVNMDRENLLPYFNLELLYEGQEKFESAKQHIEEVLKIEPEHKKAKQILERVNKKLEE